MNDEQLLKARLMDLAKKAYKQNIYTYTGFLTPAELSIFDEISGEFKYVGYEINGGYEDSERQMVSFGSEELFGYENIWPIKILCVEPYIEKFADELSHRDFLGAVMNLGIDRSVIGDILVKENKKAYIFCHENIFQYITESLTKIKHTNVKVHVMEEADNKSLFAPELVDMSLIVSSPRFDAIVAAVTKNSRSETLKLFSSKKVLRNGRVEERNSVTLKNDDIFSIRGYGKYKFIGCGNETRKGRLYVNLKKYK
ncbi:MAG: hypothetical protein E7259_06895 [Lachnospiraceae bacterium]|nr:hypothetical protein [Lachnospiraceae bacterium]